MTRNVLVFEPNAEHDSSSSSHLGERSARVMLKRILFLMSLVFPMILVQAALAGGPPDIVYNSFEYADMRSGSSIGMTVLPPGEQPDAPAGICHGTVGSGVCTGFTDTPGLNFVNDPAQCHGGNWCARADFAAGSMGQSPFLQSGYWPGFIQQACSTNGTNATCATRHWFFRYYIKWAANFSLIPFAPDTVCQGKMMYVRGTMAGSTFHLGFAMNGGNTINLRPIYYKGGVDYPNLPGFDVRADGQWHALEVEVDTPGNRIRIWWDDVLKTDVYTPDYGYRIDANFAVDVNTWGMYMNNLGYGACRAVNTTSFWIDDIAVSSQRIGGGGSSTFVPTVWPNAPGDVTAR